MLYTFRNLQKVFNVQWPWHSPSMLPTIVNVEEFCISNLATPYREGTPYASHEDAQSSYVGFDPMVTSPAFGTISRKLKLSNVLLATINNLHIYVRLFNNESSCAHTLLSPKTKRKCYFCYISLKNALFQKCLRYLFHLFSLTSPAYFNVYLFPGIYTVYVMTILTLCYYFDTYVRVLKFIRKERNIFLMTSIQHTSDVVL